MFVFIQLFTLFKVRCSVIKNLYDRTSCFEQIKFTTEDTNVKHRNILIIYDQYLIRNYLQKILKCKTVKLGLLDKRCIRIKGVERKSLEASSETAN
jgi:hypothetical protein